MFPTTVLTLNVDATMPILTFYRFGGLFFSLGIGIHPRPPPPAPFPQSLLNQKGLLWT